MNQTSASKISLPGTRSASVRHEPGLNRVQNLGELRQNGSADAPLGTNGKTIPLSNSLTFRQKASKRRKTAGDKVEQSSPKLYTRLCNCGWAPHANVGAISAVQNIHTGSAFVLGVQSCKSVWACQTCSASINWQRKLEVDHAFKAARAEKLKISMLTLTASHRKNDRLDGLLEKLTAARRAFFRKYLKEIHKVGYITALEIMHSPKNGWHPHYHTIVFHDSSVNLDYLNAIWRRCLKNVGLYGNQHACKVQDASAAEQYITKFGAGEELTLTSSKTGNNGSRSPWELMDGAENCKKDGKLVEEYLLATNGKRQLVWSQGLKARFKIDELCDVAICDEIENSKTDPANYKIVRTFTLAEWAEVRDGEIWQILAEIEKGFEPPPNP